MLQPRYTTVSTRIFFRFIPIRVTIITLLVYIQSVYYLSYDIQLYSFKVVFIINIGIMTIIIDIIKSLAPVVIFITRQLSLPRLKGNERVYQYGPAISQRSN